MTEEENAIDPSCWVKAYGRGVGKPISTCPMTKRRTDFSAILSAAMVTTASVQFAGRTVLLTSATMVLSATSHLLMDVELAHSPNARTVKSGAYSGIPSAVKASITSHAASAPLIVPNI